MALRGWTPRADGLRQLFLREPVCRKNVDLAAKHWVKTRKWPLIDKEVAQYLLMRFMSAAVYLHEMDRLRPVFRAKEATVLSWLLVQNWRDWGHSNWLRNSFGEAAVLTRVVVKGT